MLLNNALQLNLRMKKFLYILIGLLVLVVIAPNRLSYSTVIPKESVAKEVAPSISMESNQKLTNQLNRSDIQAIVFNKSREYGMNWQLIMAIIEQESKFDEMAVSKRGAQGLMQIMPGTQKDITENLGNVFNPHGNIDLGINYFSKLYKLFESSSEEDRISLALAAYNAGPSRIYDAQEVAAYLGEDPFSWRAIQNALPLLSKRFQSLHQSIWDGGKPRNGYFGSWRQTILYVKNIKNFWNQRTSSQKLPLSN